MTSQGTCRVHFHPIMPLLYLGHQLIVVPVNAFPLDGVSGRQSCAVKTLLPWWAKSGLGELIPVPSTILGLPPLQFPPTSQLKLRLTGEARGSKVSSHRRAEQKRSRVSGREKPLQA